MEFRWISRGFGPFCDSSDANREVVGWLRPARLSARQSPLQGFLYRLLAYLFPVLIHQTGLGSCSIFCCCCCSICCCCCSSICCCCCSSICCCCCSSICCCCCSSICCCCCSSSCCCCSSFFSRCCTSSCSFGCSSRRGCHCCSNSRRCCRRLGRCRGRGCPESFGKTLFNDLLPQLLDSERLGEGNQTQHNGHCHYSEALVRRHIALVYS
uniref:Uncharacterized protein n=1 Tax=Anopheles marajoara TaxID=58244 RepID=A0A2M4BZJ6_9DIPT